MYASVYLDRQTSRSMVFSKDIESSVISNTNKNIVFVTIFEDLY